MIIKSDSDNHYPDQDFFEIDTDNSTVKATYYFDNVAGKFEDWNGRKVTPEQWTYNIANNDNDSGIEELNKFLDDHEYTIDLMYKNTQ